ncbi:MAG: hypothetical protein ABW321_11185 [Polyangiales bacterium]
MKHPKVRIVVMTLIAAAGIGCIVFDRARADSSRETALLERQVRAQEEQVHATEQLVRATEQLVRATEKCHR